MMTVAKGAPGVGPPSFQIATAEGIDDRGRDSGPLW